MKRQIVLAMVVATAGAALILMIPTTKVYSADKEPRFPQLKMEQLNDQQRPFAEEIMKISSIGISGPYNSMLRSPVMGQRLFNLLDYVRFNTSVPRKLNEFAILIQARLWTSQVEWYAHYPLAIKAGLPEAVAADLKEGELFSEQQVIDLIAVSGTYIIAAMMANTAEEAVPAGKTPPLQPLPAR